VGQSGRLCVTGARWASPGVNENRTVLTCCPGPPCPGALRTSRSGLRVATPCHRPRTGKRTEGGSPCQDDPPRYCSNILSGCTGVIVRDYFSGGCRRVPLPVGRQSRWLEFRISLSDDALARAKYELLSFKRGEAVSCACQRCRRQAPHDFPNQGPIYAMDENAEFWTVQLDDIGLIALDEPPPRPARPGSGHHLHALDGRNIGSAAFNGSTQLRER
jgi:hypothetical protein